jgi:hypothetical protein
VENDEGKGKLKGKQQGIYTYEDEFTTKPCNPEQTNAETNTSKTLCFTQFQLCQRSFVYHNKAHHPYQQITLTPLGNHDAFQPYQIPASGTNVPAYNHPSLHYRLPIVSLSPRNCRVFC